MDELKRANKITAYWEKDGVATGIFYKTHEKIVTIKSNDEAVISAGFVMPEGTEEVPVTAAQKLEAFKNFICVNAAVFGVMYDPIDRRADEFKFPGKYTEETIVGFASKMLVMSVEKTLTSIQSNVIDKMIKAGHIAEGATVQYGYGEPNVVITESYSNGNLKYATVEFPVTITVGDKKTETTVCVELVSGQLKKPRNIGNTVLTMSGVKELLIDGGVIPKIEKAKKADTDTEDEDVDKCCDCECECSDEDECDGE